MSEGNLEDWAAAARAIDDRVRELGWRQRELAERSRVSLAVVREIQQHTDGRDDRQAGLPVPFGPCAFHGRNETRRHPVCGSVHSGVHSCTARGARGCFTPGEVVAR